jgi:hypothetical protein
MAVVLVMDVNLFGTRVGRPVTYVFCNILLARSFVLFVHESRGFTRVICCCSCCPYAVRWVCAVKLISWTYVKGVSLLSVTAFNVGNAESGTADPAGMVTSSPTQKLIVRWLDAALAIWSTWYGRGTF